MPYREEYLKSIINRLSIRDLCAVGSILIQEDLEHDRSGPALMATEEELFSENGQMVTLGISGPKGPDPNIRFLNYYH